MAEPLLTGEFVVGNLRLHPKVKLSLAQAAVDRLHERYTKLNDVMLQVKEFEARLPESLKAKIDAALSMGSR
jgi:hypothetical protein